MKPTVPVKDGDLTKQEYFQIFREYRMCEQNLLNHRITWNLTIQGFLFATFGFCVQKLLELEAGGDPAKIDQARYAAEQHLRFLVNTVSVLGIVLSMVILLAMCAAGIVLWTLGNAWAKIDEHPPYLPNPAGAGKPLAVLLGFCPPIVIPVVFIFVWVFIYRHSW